MCRAIFTEQLTVQVKGAAKMMVTVVATQELAAGDVLRRFGAETAQDEPRRGNNIVVAVGLAGLVAVCVGKLSMNMGLFSLVLFFSCGCGSFLVVVVVVVHVCVCV